MQRSEEPSWDDVQLFLALCRARTVGEAGRAIGVDASTVSRRLGVLEDQLGVRLFDRGRAGVAPTEAAERLMPVAERIEDAMRGFTTAAEGLEREVEGLVRVTSPADVAEVVLAPLLPELFRRHPGLKIELEPSESLADLARREADIALRVVRPERGDLIVTKLFDLDWVLAASPKLARSLGTLRSWTDVPWVGWGERFAHVPPARWLEKHLPTEPAVRSDSLRLQLAVIAAGVGAGLVPSPSVEPYGLEPVKLGARLRPAAATWPTAELFLVTHRALRDVPRVRVVWELLRERLGNRARPRSASRVVRS